MQCTELLTLQEQGNNALSRNGVVTPDTLRMGNKVTNHWLRQWSKTAEAVKEKRWQEAATLPLNYHCLDDTSWYRFNVTD